MPCRALPVAGAYPSRMTALRAPNDLEREALDTINADRTKRALKPLIWDGLVSAVAREHSKDMAEHDDFEYVSPRLGSIEYRLHRAGCSAPNAEHAIFRLGAISSLVTQLTRETRPFHALPTTHLGLGIVSKGIVPKALYITLISREKHSTLEPFPTRPEYGKRYHLKGRIDPGYTEPKLVITLPSGKVETRPIGLSKTGRFETLVYFTKGKGKYTVEIVARGKLGPMVLDLMHCYAGVPYPKPPARQKPVATPTNLRQAERMMFEMVNRARDDAGLPLLKYDDRLATVARLHSTDMLRNGFFAHISPTHGTLSNRLDRASIKALTFTENLSSNTDLGAAHRGLMDSPGHRKNILDPNVTHVGIGITRGPNEQLYITQNFKQEFRAYDTDTLASNLLKEINAARAARDMSELKTHAMLSRIARENSRWMLREKRLGSDRALALLKKEKPQFGVKVLLLKSTAPAAPEQFAVETENRKKKYAAIGIGIVQSASPSGEKFLWTTVLLGEK